MIQDERGRSVNDPRKNGASDETAATYETAATDESAANDGTAATDERSTTDETAAAEVSADDLEPTPLIIDGQLDLHQFAPRDVKELVPDYLRECRQRGILDVRIVHGKGIGTLRTIVHGILADHPAVEWFGHPRDGSSWGATVVRLRPVEDAEGGA